MPRDDRTPRVSTTDVALYAIASGLSVRRSSESRGGRIIPLTVVLRSILRGANYFSPGGEPTPRFQRALPRRAYDGSTLSWPGFAVFLLGAQALAGHRERRALASAGSASKHGQSVPSEPARGPPSCTLPRQTLPPEAQTECHVPTGLGAARSGPESQVKAVSRGTLPRQVDGLQGTENQPGRGKIVVTGALGISASHNRTKRLRRPSGQSQRSQRQSAPGPPRQRAAVRPYYVYDASR